MTDLEHVQHSPARQQGTTLAALIEAAIEQADQERAALAEAGDLEGLAYGLAAIRDVTRQLSMLERQTDGDVSRLHKERPEQNTVVPGLGALDTRRRSTRTRWESDLLFGRLIDAIGANAVVDENTGEITGDVDTAARMTALLREHLAPCLPLTASMGWRTTGLKQAGIDPNQYREQEAGPLTTRIISADDIK